MHAGRLQRAQYGGRRKKALQKSASNLAASLGRVKRSARCHLGLLSLIDPITS
jgi:hypothetical protein